MINYDAETKSVSYVARMLGLTRQAIYVRIRRGTVKAVHPFQGATRIPQSEVDRLWQERQSKSTERRMTQERFVEVCQDALEILRNHSADGAADSRAAGADGE